MRIHRRWVLGGFPSLAAADTHVSIGARERGQDAPAKAPARATSLREAIGAPVALPRPPGIGADHPLVASGVLA